MRLTLALALTCAALAACGSKAPAAALAGTECAGLPPLSERVMDQAQVIGAPVRAKLAAELARLERVTKDQLVVVTVTSLEGRSIEEVGLAMGRCWGVGQKGLDNGVLLLVAPAERKVRIEVGYGLEGLLKDATARAIIDEALVPAFKAGHLEGGIEAGVARIEGVLLSDRRRPQRLAAPART